MGKLKDISDSEPYLKNVVLSNQGVPVYKGKRPYELNVAFFVI